MTVRILQGDVLTVLAGLPEASVHCVVTSPPYWGLRSYCAPDDPAKVHEIGSEPTVEAHMQKLVEVFRAVRRVLRPDGIMFVNYGDAYSTPGGNYKGGVQGMKSTTGRMQNGPIKAHQYQDRKPMTAGLDGQLLCLPERLMFALQADGWILRSKIVWAKGLSGDMRCGSVMPESVQGTRWERCRVKTAPCPVISAVKGEVNRGDGGAGGHVSDYRHAEWSDCPGCPRCSAAGGYVLRRGQWRPTSAYEMVFMFAAGKGAWTDGEAVREAHVEPWRSGRRESAHPHNGRLDDPEKQQATFTVAEREYNPSGANMRNVWYIGTQSFKGAHFATFPEKLVIPCIKIGTSEKGVCPKCGAPWARVIESSPMETNRTERNALRGTRTGCSGTMTKPPESRTLGWRPTCECYKGEIANLVIQTLDAMCANELKLPPRGYRTRNARKLARQQAADTWIGRAARYVEWNVLPYLYDDLERVPATVLDPFGGSGTTGLVAAKLGRNAVLVELNAKYVKMAANRIRDAAGLVTEVTREEVPDA